MAKCPELKKMEQCPFALKKCTLEQCPLKIADWSSALMHFKKCTTEQCPFALEKVHIGTCPVVNKNNIILASKLAIAVKTFGSAITPWVYLIQRPCLAEQANEKYCFYNFLVHNSIDKHNFFVPYSTHRDTLMK
jgi:hypothetical protein